MVVVAGGAAAAAAAAVDAIIAGEQAPLAHLATALQGKRSFGDDVLGANSGERKPKLVGALVKVVLSCKDLHGDGAGAAAASAVPAALALRVLRMLLCEPRGTEEALQPPFLDALLWTAAEASPALGFDVQTEALKCVNNALVGYVGKWISVLSSLLFSGLVWSGLVASFGLLSSRLFSSLLVSSRLFSSLLVSSRLFSSLLLSPRLFSSLLVSSRLFSSLLLSSPLFSSLLLSSPLFSSLLFPSLLFSSRPVSCRPPSPRRATHRISRLFR